MTKRILTTIVLLFCCHLILLAQNNTSLNSTHQDLSEVEVRIESLASTLLKELPREKKDSINKALVQVLSASLQKDDAFMYSFDQVKSLSILTAPDSTFKLFNWEVAYLDGTNRYECLLMKKTKDKVSVELLQAIDTVMDNESLAEQKLDNHSWIPALYYKIIPVKTRFQTLYTLLAWDGNDLLTNKKYIEVLWFDQTGKTNFGSPIFRDNRTVKSRVIFEYGGQNSMNLNYEEELGRISFSHLAPPSSTLEGIFEYYGADVTFDAYEWKGNYWQFINEVIPAWADPKGRTKTNVSKKPFTEEDVANPNSATKILKDAEKSLEKTNQRPQY